MTVTEENVLKTSSKTEATSDCTSSLETRSAVTLKGNEQKPKNLRCTKCRKICIK